MNKETLKKIEEIIVPILEAKNLDLIDIEYTKSTEGNILRIYIDKDNGVTLEDCEDVSIVLSAVMDTYDFISEHYILEVSSPGLYRELKKEKDFVRYLGHRVKVKLYQSLPELEGQKVIIGELKEYKNNYIKIALENNRELFLDLTKVAKVNLEPNINDMLKQTK